VIELFQAEWCPYSHRVRQRLTELGVDVVIRQVPADRAARDELQGVAGSPAIPTLVREDGDPLVGAEAILAWLNDRFEEREDAGRHRALARVEVPLFEELQR